jgi:hypothetical protein
MAGEEVFGSQKRKADVPLEFEGELHRPDEVNFSRPRIVTKSSRANHATCSLLDVVEELFPEPQEDQAPNNLGTMVDVGRPGHVTAIHETACKEMEWHIARLLLQQRPTLPNKLLPRRSARPRLFRATNPQPPHILASCSMLIRRSHKLWSSFSAMMT